MSINDGSRYYFIVSRSLQICATVTANLLRSWGDCYWMNSEVNSILDRPQTAHIWPQRTNIMTLFWFWARKNERWNNVNPFCSRITPGLYFVVMMEEEDLYRRPRERFAHYCIEKKEAITMEVPARSGQHFVRTQKLTLSS